jgi:hypothetical protein
MDNLPEPIIWCIIGRDKKNKLTQNHFTKLESVKLLVSTIRLNKHWYNIIKKAKFYCHAEYWNFDYNFLDPKTFNRSCIRCYFIKYPILKRE